MQPAEKKPSNKGSARVKGFTKVETEKPDKEFQLDVLPN